jgi:hypothetical protein
VDNDPPHWNRLLPARWDAEHYLNLGLRLYKYCPAERMRAGKPAGGMPCDLAFYPGYPVLGHLLSFGGSLPIDWVMLGISLVASWIALYLWTGPEIVEALGLRAAWVSLFVFNTFTSAFFLVTILTEPVLLACAIGAFVLLARDRLWLAAIVAGAGTGARITGVALSAGFALALVVKTFRERPLPARVLVARAAMLGVAGWGQALIMAYHGLVLGDPLLYIHAYERGYGTQSSLAALFRPDNSWLMRSFDMVEHAGVWVLIALLFLLLGGREALRRFPPEARAYWMGLTSAVLFISITGTVTRSFLGMSRYVLIALPIFFAAGKLFARRTLALGLWAAFSLWHYWNVDLCLYIGDRSPNTFKACHFAGCTEAR